MLNTTSYFIKNWDYLLDIWESKLRIYRNRKWSFLYDPNNNG